MADTLIIRLLDRPRHGPSDVTSDVLADEHAVAHDANEAQWLLIDPIGGRLGMMMQGALSEAAALAATRKIIVLVPGTQTSIAEPVLPIKRGAHLEQVARYALEESLASDIDELHFTVGKRNPNGGTSVVLIQHSVIANYLTALTAAGLVPDAIYAEPDVIPTVPGGNCVIIDRGLLYLKRGAAPGATLDVHPLNEALQLAIGSANEVPTENLIYVTQADYDREGAVLESWRALAPSTQIKTLPEGPLPLFALQAAQFAALNLMSGPYARKKSWNKTLAPWRFAATLFGVAILLYLTASGLQFWRLSKMEAQLDKQIRELVVQTLPGVANGDVRNARKQFEERLVSLQSGQNASGLLHGLDILSAALEQSPGTRLDALAYRTKVLDLRVTAPSVDALDRIQHLASEQGMTAEIQSATPRDNKVEGRLQLKAGSI